MSSGEYLVGAGYLLVVVGASAAAAISITRRRRVEPGIATWLAVGLLLSLFVYAAHMLPGIIEALTREAVALTAMLVLAIVLLAPVRERARPGETLTASAPASRTSSMIGFGALAAVAVYALALLLASADEGLLQVDVISFHLPNVTRWIQSDSLWQVDDFIPHRAPGNYPQTGDVLMLAAILPWESDFLVRFVPVPFLALTSLGIYGTGRELGVRASSCALIAAAFLSMPVVTYIAGNGLADPQMLGTFSAGGYFLLRHWRTRDTADLVLAGIGLGLAFGTRWYAVPAVVAALLVWLVVSRIGGRWSARTVREGATLLGLVAICGGFWLLRNIVESGNPVFPVKVDVLGVTLFDAPHDVFRELQGFSISDYVTEPGVWVNYFWDPFLAFMGWSSVLLWGGLVVGALLAAGRLRASLEPRHAPAVLALVAFAGLVGLAYLITPYSASGLEGAPGDAWVNARYVVPALLAGAVVTGWVLMRLARIRTALEVLLAIAVLDTLRRAAELPGGDVSTGAIGAAAAVVALACSWLALGRGMFAAAISRPAVVGSVSGLVLVVGVALGAWLQDRYEDQRYAGLSEPFDFIEEAPSGAKVGIVGDGFGNYPLFGSDLSNDVSYVGPRIDHMLRPYTDQEEFGAAVSREEYDLVLVEEVSTVDAGLPQRQEGWLKTLGYRQVSAGIHPTLGEDVELRLYARS